MPVDKKKKRVANSKTQSMDSRLAALFEIQEQLRECWKFLTENRFQL